MTTKQKSKSARLASAKTASIRATKKTASIRATKTSPKSKSPHEVAASPKATVLNLARYEIGTRLRHARLMKGARLKDVADRAGCSESLVSKIENNKLEPSLQVLGKLCAVLKIGLGDLFTPPEEDDPVVTQAGQRSFVETDDFLRRGSGIRMERVIPYTRGHLLQSNIHVVAPGGGSFGLISHPGEEVGYLIVGEIELFVGDKVYRLSAGDTFCFRSEVGHGYRNLGATEARILFVNTPPAF
jgi:transcriptional regulator with XRE-family HTH domain